VTKIRELNAAEKMLVSRIAAMLPDEPRRRQLLQDLENSKVESANEKDSRLIFHIEGYHRPPYEGQRSFGVEGQVVDRDGAIVSIDLYADQNDRVLELEFIRQAEKWEKVLGPDWNSLTLY
jgi:CHASE2 domain-containing sensor protein